jgi:hypothetical protein
MGNANYDGKVSHALAFLLGLKTVSKETLSGMMHEEMGEELAQVLVKYAMGSMQDVATLQGAMAAGATMIALGYLLRATEEASLAQYARAVNSEPKN